MIRTLLISIFLVGCANTNPFQVAEDQSATLQNRLEKKDQEQISLLFVALDGEILDPGWWTRPVEASYKAPAGVRNVVVRIVHRPKTGLFSSVKLLEANAALTVSLATGRTYIAVAEVDQGIAVVSVQDMETDQAVGESVASRLTPIQPSTVVPIMMPVN